jgi:aquaporin Z
LSDDALGEKTMRDHVWWKHLHWPEYGAELLGTAFLLFAGVSAVVFDFGTGSPLAHVLPDKSARLLITGLLFAGSGSLVAISPLGKLSGAHINPAVSLAFWVQGKMHRLDLGGYILGQFLGAIIGTLLVALVWGGRAASVMNGATLPGAGYPLWAVFLAEVCLTFLLVLSIFLFVSSHRLMRWTPLMVWILVAMMVWLEAPISGTSLNPARSFGPALISWVWHDHWLYWLAPPLGALLAVGAFRLLTAGGRDVLTGKLFHVTHYRSVFMNVSAPCMPADGKLRKTV